MFDLCHLSQFSSSRRKQIFSLSQPSKLDTRGGYKHDVSYSSGWIADTTHLGSAELRLRLAFEQIVRFSRSFWPGAVACLSIPQILCQNWQFLQKKFLTPCRIGQAMLLGFPVVSRVFIFEIFSSTVGIFCAILNYVIRHMRQDYGASPGFRSGLNKSDHHKVNI